MKTCRSTRKSGIECLKVIAIFMIVLSHVVQTLCTEFSTAQSSEYVIPLQTATRNLQYECLSVFRCLGTIGNMTFFVCSAWFLLENHEKKYKKAIELLVNVWLISVIWLIATIALQGGVSSKLVVKSVFPTLFGNNWYMTCYMIFLLAFPFLNRTISCMSRREHLRCVCITSVMWIGVNFFDSELLFASDLLLWITVYMIVAYIKFYVTSLQESTKKNIMILAFGIVGFVAIIVVTNYLGLIFFPLKNAVLRWNTNSNPFAIIIAISSFLICIKLNFKSTFINYISSHSLLIYLIHENILFREIFRPVIWNWIYNRFGYSYILLWTILFAILLFVGALALATLYDCTIRRWLSKWINGFYQMLRMFLLEKENHILGMK